MRGLRPGDTSFMQATSSVGLRGGSMRQYKFTRIHLKGGAVSGRGPNTKPVCRYTSF